MNHFRFAYTQHQRIEWGQKNHCTKTWIERSAGIGNKQDLFSKRKKETDVNYRLKPYTKLEWEIESVTNTFDCICASILCTQVLNNNLFLQPTHNSILVGLCVSVVREHNGSHQLELLSGPCCVHFHLAIGVDTSKWWKHKMKNGNS